MIDDQIEKFRIKLLKRLRKGYPLILWDVRHDGLKVAANDYLFTKLIPEYFVIRAENNSIKINFSFGSRIPYRELPLSVIRQINNDLTHNIKEVVNRVKKEARQNKRAVLNRTICGDCKGYLDGRKPYCICSPYIYLRFQ